MYKPAYTYRGVPIIPGARNAYRPGRRKSPPSPWKIGMLIFIIIALVSLTCCMIASQEDEKEAEDIAITTRTTPVPVKKRSAPPAAPVSAPAPEKQENIPTLSQNAGQGVSLEQQDTCRAAEELLKDKKYEEARQKLTGLLNGLSTSTEFYQHVVKLLGITADELLANNQFVPPYTDYTVRSGDYLSTIARKHNTSIDRIMEANDIPNPNRIKPGMTLRIPANTWSAEVQLKTKRVMVYERGRLIKVYHLHFTHTPRLRNEKYTLGQSNSIWQQLQLNSSDIKNIRKFLPVGTTILIEKNK